MDPRAAKQERRPNDQNLFLCCQNCLSESAKWAKFVKKSISLFGVLCCCLSAEQVFGFVESCPSVATCAHSKKVSELKTVAIKFVETPFKKTPVIFLFTHSVKIIKQFTKESHSFWMRALRHCVSCANTCQTRRSTSASTRLLLRYRACCASLSFVAIFVQEWKGRNVKF